MDFYNDVKNKLNNQFDLLKKNFADYSERFEKYTENQQKNINTIREATGRGVGKITDRMARRTDVFIYPAESNLKKNNDIFVKLQAGIKEVEKSINNINSTDSFDTVSAAINELRLKIEELVKLNVIKPLEYIPRSPIVRQAALSNYADDMALAASLAELKRQYAQFSKTAEGIMPQQLDRFYFDKNEMMLAEHIAGLAQGKEGYMANQIFNKLREQPFLVNSDTQSGYQ